MTRKYTPKKGVCRICNGETCHKNTTRCKQCCVNDSRKHPSRWEGQRRTRILRQYGITLEEFDELWKATNSVCPICKTEMKLPVKTMGQKLNTVHIDHNHATGKIRGLICGACNTALGLFKDNIESLESAITYLKESE